jgi:hypothetical protein
LRGGAQTFRRGDDAAISVPAGWPTACGGDVNQSNTIDLADMVYIAEFIFNRGPAPRPLDTGDVNCDGMVNISDLVYLISYILGGGPAPCAE